MPPMRAFSSKAGTYYFEFHEGHSKRVAYAPLRFDSSGAYARRSLLIVLLLIFKKNGTVWLIKNSIAFTQIRTGSWSLPPLYIFISIVCGCPCSGFRGKGAFIWKKGKVLREKGIVNNIKKNIYYRF